MAAIECKHPDVVTYPVLENSFSSTALDVIGRGYNTNVFFPNRNLWGAIPQTCNKDDPVCIFNMAQMPYYNNDYTYLSRISPAPMATKYNSCGSVSYEYVQPPPKKWYGTAECNNGVVTKNQCFSGYDPSCQSVGNLNFATCSQSDSRGQCDYGYGFNSGQWGVSFL